MAEEKRSDSLSESEVPVTSNGREEPKESDSCDEVNDTLESCTVEDNTSKVGLKVNNNSDDKSLNQITKEKRAPKKLTPPTYRKPLDYNESLAELHYIQILPKPPSKHPRAVFLCTICQYYCDTWSVVEQHIQRGRHVSALEDVADEKSIKLLPKPRKEQITSITKLLKRTVAEQGIDKLKERQSVVSQLQSIVDSNFAGCKIELYGSSVYNVGLRTSDVNLNLLVPSTQEGPTMLVNVYEVMKKESSFSDVESFIYADIPYISFVENDSKLKCSLTLNDPETFQIAVLLRKYISFDPRVQAIATAFRYWAHLCKLDLVDGGSLPAYAFSILVVYYMQQTELPVLPVFHELSGLPPEDLFMPDKCGVVELQKLWKSRNNMSLGLLWLDLFKFYLLKFDMSELVVSIRSSKGVSRASKKWTGNRLAIEDPVTFRNVSRTLVNGKTFIYLMRCLRATYLYFATLQMSKGSIFRRVQELPVGVINMERLIAEREAFLKFICDRHPCFLNEEEARKREECGVKLLKPSDVNYYDIGQFIVTPDQALLLFKNFNTNYVTYEFSRTRFSGGKELPLVCILCREEGHYKDKCPDEYLPPMNPLPEHPDSFLEALSKHCEAMYDTLALSGEEVGYRRSIVSHLEEFLKTHFPDAVLALFGSSCNGFGLKSSDVDICMYFKEKASKPEKEPADLVRELSKILEDYPPFTKLCPIPTARVPILKFKHKESKLGGDISFNNVLPLENTKLLMAYCDIDKRTKVLGSVVKNFTKECGISDASKGSLSSYAYVLMLIYFLQQCTPPVLPVLQEIERPDLCEEDLIEGCDTYFYKDLESLQSVWPEYGKNTESVGKLWIDFLCFYTEIFDFKINVISIRKKDIMRKCNKSWNGEQMAIEDPFDLHNLGGRLGKKMFHYIILQLRKGREYFGNPENMIQNDASVPGAAESYFNNRIFKGNPPDRGCHYCKNIGHLLKDCPNKGKSRNEVIVKKFNEKVIVNSNIVANNRRPIQKGLESKNFVGGIYKHSNGEKGRKLESGLRNIPQQRPAGERRDISNFVKGSPLLYVHPATRSNLPYHLQGNNVPPEHIRQYQESHHEQHSNRDHPRNPPFTLQSHPVGRKVMGRLPPQVRSSELVDVFTQPTPSETKPTLQFYNSVTGRPPHL